MRYQGAEVEVVDCGQRRDVIDETVFVERELSARATPAFWDGDRFITPDMKYSVKRDKHGSLALCPEQELSIAGFERNMYSCCDTSGCEYTWASFVKFNSAAEAYRQEWRDRELAAIDARETKERAIRDAHEAETRKMAEHQTALSTLLNAAKFTRGPVTIALDPKAERNSDIPYITDLLECAKKAYCYQGIAVHRAGSKGQWRLTHIASGLSTGFEYDSLSHAKLAAVRLAQVTDWTQDQKSLLKGMKGFPLSVLKRDAYAML